MPGAVSLSKQEYYGHPRNHFWPLLYTLFGSGLPPSPVYEERVAFALAHGIALWDVLAACERKGSLDADIRDPEANNFAVFFQIYPAVERVFFNGQAAEQLYRRRVVPLLRDSGIGTGIGYRTLPSSSPARTLAFEAKLAAWRGLADS
jgi:hypoxanthine-DNA glycosylase